MTALNQDFSSFAGDDQRIIFTVRDNDGAIIDLSEAAEIVWKLYDEYDAVILTRSLSVADIEFVTDGSDGQLSVSVSENGAAVTEDLTGWYWHAAYVQDSVGNLSTFETGRGLFGPQIAP